MSYSVFNEVASDLMRKPQLPAKVDRSPNRKPTRADIVTYVEWLVFMPGWSFVVFPEVVDYVVDINILRTMPDSDYPPVYRKPLYYQFNRELTIDVREIQSLDDVGYKLLTACIEWLNDPETNEHEAREFFRVHVGSDPATDTGPDNWQAPFHPHRLSGRSRWDDRTGGQSQGC